MTRAPKFKQTVERPELIIGLAGAVGVDTDFLQSAVTDVLKSLAYEAELIHVINLLEELPRFKGLTRKPENERVKSRMQAGNTFRQLLNRGDALAVYAMAKIRTLRAAKTNDANTSAANVAYLVRSLKTPEEVQAFRKIYGPAFILISAYSPREVRVARLSQVIATSRNDSGNPKKYRESAEQLIEIDAKEEGVKFGQNLRDAFPLADVFVEVSDPNKRTEESLTKFFELLFRHPYHTPSKEEHGMYLAYSGALRSSDLGRQVGASIADPAGDIFAIGSNEVPQAGGGQYWHGDEPDGRDFKRQYFAFDSFRREILVDILERLKKMGWLKAGKSYEDMSSEMAETTMAMDGALYQDVIEYGRTVHAEMAALLAAARRGSTLEDATLFSTTFPCHECARNIVIAGIRKVVYIHPYSKSRVESLFNDSIVVDGQKPYKSEEKDSHKFVEFRPFVGIAPHRYAVLFDASGLSRKRNGKIVKWDGRAELPREVEIMRAYSRMYREQVEVGKLYDQMKDANLIS